MKYSDILEAKKRIDEVIYQTPLMRSSTFSTLTGAEIYLKAENQQKTGSFKMRGAFNKISKLLSEGNLNAVIASSAGNHAQGVAYAALKNNVKCYIVMPQTAPLAKIDATKSYGAEIILHGDVYDDAYNKALELAKEKNAVFIHPFDDEDIIAGQGTTALEILEKLPTVDTIIVPAGGGGLLAGIAFAVKQINPKICVVGVQAENADAIKQSFDEKHHKALSSINTIADGIAVKNPGKISLDLICKNVDMMFSVSDSEIASAIVMLLERTKQVVEPAGAASVALALSKKLNLTGQKVVCLLSGGNIDVGFMHKIIEKGLISRGRLIEFSVILPDKPDSLLAFSKVMSESKANVISMQYDRLSAHLQLNETTLHVACEVSGFSHTKALIKKLTESGLKIHLSHSI